MNCQGYNMLHFENTDSDFLNVRIIESTTQRNKKNQSPKTLSQVKFCLEKKMLQKPDSEWPLMFLNFGGIEDIVFGNRTL